MALGWSLSPLIRARKLLALRYKSSWWGSGYKQHLDVREAGRRGKTRCWKTNQKATVIDKVHSDMRVAVIIVNMIANTFF